MTFIYNSRGIRFLIGGSIAAAFNLVAIALLIEHLGFNTPLLRNIANVIAIELSLLFSFAIYRAWVWPGGDRSLRHILFKQLPLYHISASLAIFSRSLLVFPILDRLGVNYGINTLAGALLSAGINYAMSDRLIFNNRRDRGHTERGSAERCHTDL